jgi:tRNA pseudouridine38-40 synthase
VFNRKYYTYLETPVDVEAMQRAAEYLAGEHDFKSFCGNSHMKKSTVRNVDKIDIRRSKGYIYFTFHGTGFLQNMVRILVGTLLEVGIGRMQPEDMPGILEAKNRRSAGPTAPAKGLCLIKVDY